MKTYISDKFKSIKPRPPKKDDPGNLQYHVAGLWVALVILGFVCPEVRAPIVGIGIWMGLPIPPTWAEPHHPLPAATPATLIYDWPEDVVFADAGVALPPGRTMTREAWLRTCGNVVIVDAW